MEDCCDLLSNFRFTFFDNNNIEAYLEKYIVVICFQTLDLRSLITTYICNPYILVVVICFQTLDLRSLITTVYLTNTPAILVVICFQTLDLRSLITTSKL